MYESNLITTKNMKKSIFFALFAAVLLMPALLMAQKKAFTGKVTYKIDFDMAGLPEEAKSMMPTTMAMYIGNDKVKTEIITVMGNQSTIIDLDEKAHITLMNVMGQKLAIKDTFEELTAQMPSTEEYSVEITDETKEIAGYSCKKAVLKKIISEGNTEEVGVAWFTDGLKVHENFNFNNPQYNKIKGLLMEYGMDAGNNMKMSFTAVEVAGMKIKEAEFEVPEDYEIITREDLAKRMGSW